MSAMLASLVFSCVISQDLKPVQVVPRPQMVWDLPGKEFVFLPGTKILTRERPQSLHHLIELVERCIGEEPEIVGELLDRQDKPVVMLSKSSTLPPEGYRVHSEFNDLVINYADDAGLFYAVQSIRQMLPADIEDSQSVRKEWSLPAIRLEDYPRFEWRGMLLDESRHFFGTEHVKRVIDWLAMHKMNVFHWHLTDDGGWRMQVDKYPLLTEIGAWREDTDGVWPAGFHNYGNIRMHIDRSQGKRYGGFYTKDQIREIVAYAADRYVTVVPEIEMPGHSLPALVAYPELACDGTEPHAEKGGSNTNAYCAGKESTFEFLEDVLDETLELFPSEFIHIGADELYKGHWQNCASCQKRIEEENLGNENELQSYFVRRIEKYLVSKGRRLIGWDEILEGGLSDQATVMSWRGEAGGIAAAKAGNDVVMTPTSHSYFDYSYEAIPTRIVFDWNPVPAQLTEEEGKHVLGGQANVWTEWIATTDRMEFMLFPRILATAESLWTHKENTEWSDFNARMLRYFERLDMIDVKYHMPAPTVDFTAAVFQNQATVTASTVEGTPFTLRYTTDGTDPDGDSRKYEGPITVSDQTIVSFALVNSRGDAGEVVKVECVKQAPTSQSGLVPGLNYTSYLGSWTSIPDFSQLKWDFEGPADEINIDKRPRDEQFAILFKGFIKIEQEGVHRFRLGSDDGSYLKIAGAKVVNHDGLHGHTVKEGAVRLTPGVYPLEVGYFQAGGGKSLELQVQLPGGEWMSAPAGLYFRKD